MSTPQTPSRPHKQTLSPEGIPLGPPVNIRVRTTHPEMDHLPSKPQLHKFAFRWDPTQFEDNKHLQKYEETIGSISYL